jgi:hypothetical protein
LLTSAAFEKLEGDKQDWQKMELSISGLELVAYKRLEST